VRETDNDTLLFFSGHLDALDLFLRLEELLYASFPDMEKRVQKTQISCYAGHMFACVSFTRVRKKAELPRGFLTLTLGLPAPLDSPRVAIKTEPYPGRWTQHIVLSAPEELDEELLSWLRDAYDFAKRKRGTI
jgi:hypothetical protein